MDLHKETQSQKLPHFFIFSLVFFIFILITSIVFCNFVTPFYPHLLHPYSFPKTLPDTEYQRSTNTCDYSYGSWVWDETYPTRKYNEDCPFLDPGFRCHRNRRGDVGYVKWRWQPHGCDLPRYGFQFRFTIC